MKSLLIIIFAIYAVIISFLIVAIVFKSIGLLIFISIILFLVLFISSYYLVLNLLKHEYKKKLLDMKLVNLENKYNSLLKFSSMFRDVYFQILIDILSLYSLLMKTDNFYESLNKIVVTKIKNRKTLLEYFLTIFLSSYLLNDLKLLNKSEKAIFLVIEKDKNYESLITNYRKLILIKNETNLTENEKEDILFFFTSLYGKNKKYILDELLLVKIKTTLELNLTDNEVALLNNIDQNTIFNK